MSKPIIAAIVALAAAFGLGQPARAADAAPAAEPLYATVNGKPITRKEFHAAYANYLRQKFYHGQVPEEQLTLVKQEVGDRLVERVLLIDEAARRGVAADEQRVAQTLAEYDARYADSPVWQKNRETMLPGLRQQLTEQDLLRQMEAIGHAIAEPTDAAVREFFKARLDLFTEPEKMHLHTILLKVDPSAPKATWDAAREEAARLVTRLRAGEASFEELARLHSHDKSANEGGDMGYLHRGMIPEQLQSQIDARPMASVGDPVDVLDGVVIFRLDGRIPSKLMDYDPVAPRARELLKRELTNQAWDKFIADLRKGAAVTLFEPAPPVLPPPKN